MNRNRVFVTSRSISSRPFLRWAGGKQRLVKYLLPFLPNRNIYRRHFEPFFGAGALFFAVRPAQAVISDVNAELMNCYRRVVKDPDKVSRLLHAYANRDGREFFYKVRSRPLKTMTDTDRAACFIYLNKAAFNGIYRVNKAGQFNVPYGPSFRGISIPSKEILISAAQGLRNAKIFTGDFEDILDHASLGDFVYLDPPYPPRSDTAFFTHYSPGRFGWDEQVRVARVFTELSSRGCLVMLSNADQKRIVTLYRRFHIFRLNAVRWLGSNGDRFGVREVIVTNYLPPEIARR
jgi:DNA adenine methylase